LHPAAIHRGAALPAAPLTLFVFLQRLTDHIDAINDHVGNIPAIDHVSGAVDVAYGIPIQRVRRNDASENRLNIRLSDNGSVEDFSKHAVVYAVVASSLSQLEHVAVRLLACI